MLVSRCRGVSWKPEQKGGEGGAEGGLGEQKRQVWLGLPCSGARASPGLVAAGP